MNNTTENKTANGRNCNETTTTYKVICSTNPYQAQRNVYFPKHHTSYVVKSNLNYDDAKQKLFNIWLEETNIKLYDFVLTYAQENNIILPVEEDYEDSYKFDDDYFKITDEIENKIFEKQKQKDSFEEDGYYYSIVEEEEEEEEN
jgi:hypothetical protein